MGKLILISVLSMMGLGLFFSLVLALVNRKFKVAVDSRQQSVEKLLPGTNCGACGFTSCGALAEALVNKKISPEQCRVCETKAQQNIAKLLGVKVTVKSAQKAVVHCQAGSGVKNRYFYRGINTCEAAAALPQALKQCRFACFGFGDCAAVCPVEAISKDNQGRMQINADLCIACGKCVPTCPQKLIELIPKKGQVFVGCVSTDKAKDVVKNCPVGCIACFKCEKACPEDAIKVKDNIAKIDYRKCTSCGKCVEVCPRKIIFGNQSSG
jgi:Na+-translocating ferredoxin:NAD+ oxidoreductase RNF subunit RnfB